MDSFKIGDKVIYPNQGLGIIEDIKEESFYGESFRIYHVRILINDTLVLIPFSNALELGIRKPISASSIKEIFDFIKKTDVDVTMNWKGRYKEYINLMKSGSILDIALVLKSLYYLHLIKPLSFREKKMMEKAIALVVAEISEVGSIPAQEVEEMITETLSLCFKDVSPRIES